MFYIKVRNIDERSELIEHLKNDAVSAVFHYIPLHSSIAGEHFGRLDGLDVNTTKESERLLRLPMYLGLKASEIDTVVASIVKFYA